ncbi:hypothetical protein EDD22DRAFT_958083 [Suillus occidentalis]|nr:hypothetical protein EDD22DRAFT_958083 [Suillus occidentalis]
MSTTEPAGVPPPTVNEELELEEDTLTLEEALTHGVPSGNPNIIPIPSSPSAAPALASGPGINTDNDNFLLVYGKYIHKETIPSTSHPDTPTLVSGPGINPNNYLLERVYSTGFTKVNRQHEIPGRSITGSDTFIIGNIFLTIVQINLTLTIALVHSSSIEHHSITHHHILASNICTPNVQLTGQILTLIPMHQPLEQCSWLWTRDYVKTCSKIQGIKQTTDKVIEITVPGRLVELINPEMTCIHMCTDINSDKFVALNNLRNMWIIEESALSLACDTLWHTVCKHSITIKNILSVPTPSDPSMFPYALADGSTGIVCIEGSQQLAAAELRPLDDCPLCGTKTDSMCAHVSLHILRASHSINETLKEQVGLIYPCGFCGRSGHNECKIQIKTLNKGGPSWNIPLKCELCHLSLTPVTGKKSRAEPGFVDAIWRYNMIQHLDDVHPQFSHPKNPIGHPLPLNILNSLTLTSLEQHEAGIP